MQIECPVCEQKCDKQGLENHMRLTSGRGHGPAGEMPPDPGEDIERSFDPEEYEIAVAMGDDEHVMSLEEAVKLAHEMLMSPESFGHVSDASHRELREGVEELRGAVVELTEAVECLASIQGEILVEVQSGPLSSPDHDGSPTVRLDEEKVIRS